MSIEKKSRSGSFNFPKLRTGIKGLDDITNGGLPKNHPTLLLGNTGCGKTILGMQFLINGIILYNEPGVFISFEEQTEELTINLKSLGHNIDKHVQENKLYLEHVKINRDENVKTGKYDLEGLFVRLGKALEKVKAKRIVLDSLDTLFYGLDYKILHSEFKRLFSWLKEKKVTAIITGEIGDTFLTRHGLEEYIADCVIVLDNRISNQIATRRIRIVKYRGSAHGNSEYPFTIDENGLTVFPLVSQDYFSKVGTARLSSGIAHLDEMLGKKGFYVGSSILISGTAGTGKTSAASSFASSVCEAKKRCLICAFEETPHQVMRNMKSIGIPMGPYAQAGLLHFYYARPSLQNLELHLIAITKIIREVRPSVVILDPITNLMTEGPNSDIRSMLIRFVDFLKTQNITVMFTAAITVGSILQNPSDEGISSMVDTWIMVQDVEVNSMRTRSLCIMKSRGMAHSNEVKKFKISSKGIALMAIETNKDEPGAYAKRRDKEHKNLSTS